MTDFDYDVMQKKKIANAARHIKRRGGRQKVRLEHDNITNRQWKELNSPVETFNLSKPMSFSKFRSMPLDLQEQYIGNLVTRFHATQKEIASMLCVSQNTFYKHCKENIPDVKFSRGARMTESDRDGFLEFLVGEKSEPASDDVPEPAEAREEAVVCGERSDNQMHVKHFKIQLSGVPDGDSLHNMLRMLCPDGEVDITITVNAIDRRKADLIGGVVFESPAG